MRTGRRVGNPRCEFVVSVICCLGLVLLANGLCFGKQQNLLPLPNPASTPLHSAPPPAVPSSKVNTCHAAAVATRAFHCSRSATS